MTRSELINKLSENYPSLSKQQIENFVLLFFRKVIDTISQGGRVELRGFGSFSARSRQPRAGRNPRTGVTVFIGEKSAPFFKAGKELRLLLNRKFSTSTPLPKVGELREAKRAENS